MYEIIFIKRLCKEIHCNRPRIKQIKRLDNGNVHQSIIKLCVRRYISIIPVLGGIGTSHKKGLVRSIAIFGLYFISF